MPGSHIEEMLCELSHIFPIFMREIDMSSFELLSRSTMFSTFTYNSPISHGWQWMGVKLVKALVAVFTGEPPISLIFLSIIAFFIALVGLTTIHFLTRKSYGFHVSASLLPPEAIEY